jgi:S-(hydroxymethyl)glutathione dehydrogenase / alcohol dehydrogenase
MGSNRFKVDMPRYIELYRQGRLKLDELISARFPLAEINEAIALANGGAARRVVVVP